MFDVRWWCGPASGTWEWRWEPYVGVWLFVATFVVGYIVLCRRSPFEGPAERRRAVGSFVSAMVLIWIVLDWPVGPLGAGYLASLHMVQFLVLGVAAPALLLLSIPRTVFDRLARSPRAAALDGITHPISAFFIFNVAMTVTHWPAVVDAMRGSAAGSFAVDVVWLITGVIFWWPVIAPVPRRPRFGTMLRVVYLGLNAILVRPPFAFLLFSRFPVYGKYELAAPLPGIDPVSDQQLAAGIMKVGTAWIMAVGVAVILIRFHRRQQADAGLPETSRSPAT